jgi:hypothetical protein
MTGEIRLLFRFTAGAAVVLALALPVAAQSQAPNQATSPIQVRTGTWATVGGFEGDTHDTGYGFFGPEYLRPIKENLSFVGVASVDYLYYEFEDGLGRHNVRSPGASARAGLRFGRTNWFQISAGPAFKRRHLEVFDLAEQPFRSDTDLQFGANVGADMWVNPSKTNNIHGILNHGTVDNYTWGRLAFKQQVANLSWQNRFTPYVGVEYIGQGNDDIRSQQAGAFVEMLHAPSSVSVMLRAGYKRSTYDVGPAKTGPWFAIGFYHRLR